MRFLLDTNVISELQRASRNPGFAAWWSQRSTRNCAISVVTLGELERGIVRLTARDVPRAKQLRAWFEELHGLFGDRILGVDNRVAREWGRMSADRSRPVADTLVAATAKVHDLTLATRNVRDFEGLGVVLLNPFT